MTQKNHFDKPPTLREREAIQRRLSNLLWDAENKLRKAETLMFLHGLKGTHTDDTATKALELLETAMSFSPWTGEAIGAYTPKNHDAVWYGVLE